MARLRHRSCIHGHDQQERHHHLPAKHLPGRGGGPWPEAALCVVPLTDAEAGGQAGVNQASKDGSQDLRNTASLLQPEHATAAQQGTAVQAEEHYCLRLLCVTCAIMYSKPRHHFMWPVQIKAKETAGLRWPPEMLANA